MLRVASLALSATVLLSCGAVVAQMMPAETVAAATVTSDANTAQAETANEEPAAPKIRVIAITKENAIASPSLVATHNPLIGAPPPGRSTTTVTARNAHAEVAARDTATTTPREPRRRTARRAQRSLVADATPSGEATIAPTIASTRLGGAARPNEPSAY